MTFLRRWHDVPSPTPPVEPSPKRLIFSQPVAELREEIAPEPKSAAAGQPAANAQPQPADGPVDTALQPAPRRPARHQPATRHWRFRRDRDRMTLFYRPGEVFRGELACRRLAPSPGCSARFSRD